MFNINNNFVQRLVNEHLPFARLMQRFSEAALQHKPQALLFNRPSLSFMESCVVNLPDVVNLPRLKLKDIDTIIVPRLPDQSKYLYDDSKELNHSAYWHALEEYKQQLQSYFTKLSGGGFQRGILINNHHFPLIMFNEKLPESLGIHTSNAA